METTITFLNAVILQGNETYKKCKAKTKMEMELDPTAKQ